MSSRSHDTNRTKVIVHGGQPTYKHQWCPDLSRDPFAGSRYAGFVRTSRLRRSHPGGLRTEIGNMTRLVALIT